jgi:hypothetical protein
MTRKFLQWSLPLLCISITLSFGRDFTPVQRLILAIVPLILSLKLSILLGLSSELLKNYSKLGLGLYLFCWPGMNPSPFQMRSSDRIFSKHRLLIGMSFFSIGVGLLILLSFFQLSLSPSVVGWGGILAMLLIVHFGFSEQLTESFHFFGWRVKPLFIDPLFSLSLREFWGKRWNLAFVEMNQLLFLPLSRKIVTERPAIFSVFIISALLHEFAISFPAGAGWGGPFSYFALHGMLVLVENPLAISSKSSFVRRIWTLGWIFLPLPVLFHSQFRNQLILPLINFLHEALC